MGIPHRIVISDKTIAADKVEYKRRTDGDAKLISEEEFLEIVN
jgi:prolyl-tRNA synthetase